jgi:hypothetical protein
MDAGLHCIADLGGDVSKFGRVDTGLAGLGETLATDFQEDALEFWAVTHAAH